jgi:hypothetical protein
MICWDGSRNAARAVADAHPFLTRAKAIELVTVSDEIKNKELRDVDIARHLVRHHLKVEVENITATDSDVPNAILSHAGRHLDRLHRDGRIRQECVNSFLAAPLEAFLQQ